MSTDRQKALDIALGAIEKQFGTGAIMRMGEGARQQVATIPTGAIGLDVALGIGGFPRGRVCELYGPESSGKCLVAGTYLWTDHGLETIEELFARVGQPASCTSRVTDVRDAGIRLVNEEGALESLAAVTHNGRRPTWAVTLESGRSVTATANHPLRKLNERGEIVWARVADLAPGDVIVSAASGAEQSDSEGLTPDEAMLLGYLISDGTLAQRNSFTFTNHHDADVVEEYTRLLHSALGIDPARVRMYGPGDHRVHDTQARARLADQYGLDFVNAEAKTVPHCVRVAGSKAQRAFLSALFEGDGWIERGPEIALTSASTTLVEQVQLLLLGLGIPCSRRAKWNEAYHREYWTVRVPPAAVARFLATVGFRSSRRTRQIERYVVPAAPGTYWEAAPLAADMVRDLRDALGGDREIDRLYHDLTRTSLRPGGGTIASSIQRLRAIVAWADARHIPSSARPLVERLRRFADGGYTYERITSIADAGIQPTFDVMVPETHSFLANGVLSHNTTVALHAIAEAQKAGGIAAFIDAEHALDPVYAAALGVDVDALLVSQPDTGEQALEITDTLVRSGAVDLLVVDSVAALTPRAEIEGEMGDSHVGLQARLMSQALRKLAGHLNRSRTCCIFINQLREKIGVMFGCFHYSTRVTLADGTQEKIGKLVNERRDVEVMSYDPDSGQIQPRRIVNWYDNGPTDEFLQFTVARPGGNGRAQFAATPNHLISTPSGWVPAGEIAVGERVLQHVTTRLSAMQWEVLLGTLMGDGALSPSRSGMAARYRFGHGKAQTAYADWKASLWCNIPSSRNTNDNGAVFYDFTPLPELAELRKALYWPQGKVLSYDYLKALTPLSLALWYCDDASFSIRSQGLQARTRGGSGRAEICVQAMEPTSRARLRDHLADVYDVAGKLVERGGKAILHFPTAETAKLQALIAPYVHPSMDYKLLPRFRGQFSMSIETCQPRDVLMPMPVVRIHRKPANQATHRFDLEIEGNGNYFVDGVMVHNSPETTPGGRALKFYSSVRLDIRRIESLKDGTDFVGNRVRVKVVKNKCVAEGTQVFDPVSGVTRPIEEIVDGNLDLHVWAADKKGRLEQSPVSALLDQGIQHVIGIRLRNGTLLRLTPDHRVLTEEGWKQAGELTHGDRVARPRRAGRFGTAEPYTADEARLIGYLIGDGYVGGKTPVAFINTEPALHDDVHTLAAARGCNVNYKNDGLYATMSHRPGETNAVLELVRHAGIYGHLAWQKVMPASVLQDGVAPEVLSNMIFGIWESDGWISREQNGGIRLGFCTTSEQLAWQIHWALLRWGITTSVTTQEAGSRRSLIAGRRVQGRRPAYQVRVSGIDNLEAFRDAMPMWGPKGQKLESLLDEDWTVGRRGSRAGYLAAGLFDEVVGHLTANGISPSLAASLIGLHGTKADGGYRAVLGSPRIRRDRLEILAEHLDDPFFCDMLDTDVYFEAVREVVDIGNVRTFDLTVDKLHNFVADGVVVHNCAPPFRQAEFDIMFGEGISKEGSLLDMGVEHGIVRKAGAWYTYDGEQLGQGRENARNFLREHDDVAEEIYKKTAELLGLVPTDVTGDETLAASDES